MGSVVHCGILPAVVQPSLKLNPRRPHHPCIIRQYKGDPHFSLCSLPRMRDQLNCRGFPLGVF